ncbi:enolase C-terminal domain-like protein [Oscillibacter sp.]|uniref:enolase C-terminal domain-like protein n=1 Tax=Oscillibacter sp. TaxID=1945593 RepID=UPI00262C25B4|nr:enolase C-terminal domain-like protein [Oscillibacter sp.]MDD3347970.1 enolase C-terminal domain-like protein [Oscillibacter sp.]
MKSVKITGITVEDRRFDLENGAGSDAVHTVPVYAYAVCRLKTDTPLDGVGLAFTLGSGNDIVCKAIEYLSTELVGREIHELMSEFGKVFAGLTDSPCYRWLGPHKGVVHLALASITNACFDLWAKVEGVPLWKLLIDLKPEEIISLLDFRYVEDFLTKDEALEILRAGWIGREERESVLRTGYRGYDTSVGWFNYPDDLVVQNTKEALAKGFTAMKLKVGSADPERDIRRAALIRQTAGDAATIMVDANQQWTLQKGLYVIDKLKAINPYWVEEPTDPDDVLAHQTLRRAFHPIRIALGEHVPNKVIFKNYLQANAMDINQVDAVRVGGISEFILISLMSKKANVPVIPHVGDMGQIHQHMVLFNHIAVGHPNMFLEAIPHLRQYFKYPVELENGYYAVPQVPGSTCDFAE